MLGLFGWAAAVHLMWAACNEQWQFHFSRVLASVSSCFTAPMPKPLSASPGLVRHRAAGGAAVHWRHCHRSADAGGQRADSGGVCVRVCVCVCVCYEEGAGFECGSECQERAFGD